MSETMKKRYEDVSATLCAIHGLKYSHCLTREEAEAIESLLDDLMAEREKLISRKDTLGTRLCDCCSTEETYEDMYAVNVGFVCEDCFYQYYDRGK